MNDAKDVATVQRAGFVDLGVLKGNIGDQNYSLGTFAEYLSHFGMSNVRKFYSAMLLQPVGSAIALANRTSPG